MVLAILKHNRPLGITLIYLVLGLMWIIASDQVALLWFSDNLLELTSFQVIKGSLFILLTAFILYLLTKNLYNELSIHKEDLELLYSNPKLGILKINEDGFIKEASDTICAMLGYSKKQIKSLNYRDITHPDDWANADYYFNKMASEGGESFHYEKRVLTKDQDAIWVELHGMIKRNENGVDYFLVSVQNIEERKQAEKQLDEELREKNALINNTDAMIYSIDLDFKIVSFNKYFAKKYYEAAGRRVQKGDYAVLEEHPEEEQEKWIGFYKRALKGEHFRSTEDFDIRDYTITIESSFYPIEKEDDIVGVSVYVRDISELRSVQMQLSERNKYLEVLTNHASDAILAVDTNEKLQYCNETFKNWSNRKTPPDNLENWPAEFGLHSIDEGRLLKKEELAIWKALHEEKVEAHEFMIKRPTENARYIQANGSAIYNGEGEKIGAMVVMRDITDRIDKDIQVANSILNSLEEERTMIASELHDGITQLLGVVNMNLKNIALERPSLKESKRFQKAMEQLQNAIEESRNISHRIMPKSIHDFGLVLSLQELTDDLQETTSLNINFDYNEDIRISKSVELNVYRIVQEAVNNCLEHAEAKTLTIKVNFENNRLIVSIQDDGCGFEPEEAKDFGIGLRTMKNRARKMEAKLSIDSSDNGSSLLLNVPIGDKVILS
jgi:PAS domain S-box-containing protein